MSSSNRVAITVRLTPAEYDLVRDAIQTAADNAAERTRDPDLTFKEQAHQRALATQLLDLGKTLNI
jgi:hypothetical protein